MHNHLPDETTLHNGQKFELLSLALLGVPSMSDTFQELTSKLTSLKFDSADYVCLKFVLLLNPGEYHRYLIEVDCSSGQFKSAKLKETKYAINAPIFFTTYQQKRKRSPNF